MFNYFANITYSALCKCDCMIGNKIVTKCLFFMAKTAFLRHKDNYLFFTIQMVVIVLFESLPLGIADEFRTIHNIEPSHSLYTSK